MSKFNMILIDMLPIIYIRHRTLSKNKSSCEETIDRHEFRITNNNHPDVFNNKCKSHKIDVRQKEWEFVKI